MDTKTIHKSARTYLDLKYDENDGFSIDEFDVDDVLREI